MKPRRLALITLVGTFAGFGCSDGGESPVEPPIPTDLVVSPTNVSLLQLDSVQIHARVLDQSGSEISGASKSWTVSGESVVSVSSSGLVRSIGPVGDATVSVTSGNLRAETAVRVVAVPSELTVDPEKATLRRGASIQLSIAVRDAVGDLIDNPLLEYASSNPSVVSVAPTGLVTALGPLGEAAITVEIGDLSATVSVIVAAHPVGTIVETVSLSNPPWAVDVSRTGVVYVSQLNAGSIVRFELPGMVTTGSLWIGVYPRSLAFDAAGTRAYVSHSGGVKVVDVATFAPVGGLTHVGEGIGLIVSPDDSTVFVGTNFSGGAGEHTVYAIDAFADTLKGAYTVGQSPNGYAFHPNDTLLYVSAYEGASVAELHAVYHRVARQMSVPGIPQGLGVSLDGSELYVANEAGTLDIVDIAAGIVTAQVVLTGGGFGLAVTPDGDHIYVSVPTAGVVQVIDAISRTIVNTIATGGDPRRIAFTRYGDTGVITNASGWVDFVR
jgi:YVTN family beta-propeller protein